MKKVIIDLTGFSLDNPKLRGLISGIAKLKSANFFYEIKVSQSPDKVCIEQLLALEELPLRIDSSSEVDEIYVIIDNENYPENKSIIQLNGEIKNIGEAIGKLLKSTRAAVYNRSTKETKIDINVELDGDGNGEINTGIGFFDHMLELLTKHSNINLKLNVDGDLHVDEHHTVEDVGIALGETIAKALGNKSGITRYGFLLPMDESIATVALDLSGRAYNNFKCKFSREKVGEFPTELTEEFFRGLSGGLRANLYIRCKGKNDHHKIECIFKAFAKALNEALRFDERVKGIPSTKGMI